MSPRKLTEDDKQSMLKMYRTSTATTSTLATEFGVSSSTVSRFLKNSLSTEEYEDLIQQKRLARTTKGEVKKAAKQVKSRKSSKPKIAKQEPEAAELFTAIEQISEVEADSETKSEVKSTSKRVRRRRSRKKEVTPKIVKEAEVVEQVEVETPESKATTDTKPLIKAVITLEKDTVKLAEEEPEIEDDDEEVDVSTVSAMLGEEEDFDDDDDDDGDDDDGDDDEVDYPHTSSQNILEILPLASASFPRTCYLVVDRAAELIVKPLQDFADLGAIPEAETQQKTLPVFDNHRVAKRFSHRREKVIKVPNGKMLQKTSSYLYDKGITRLLIRGQIYEINE